MAKLINVNDKTFAPESPIYPKTYENNVNAGTATAMVAIYTGGYYSVKEAKGSGNIQNQTASKLYESATITKTFSIAKLDLAKATVTVDPAEYTYDGKAKEPTVTVTYDGKVIPAADYKVTYESNVEVGTAKVKISAVGNNTTGSVTKDFTIKPSEEIQVKGKAHVQKDGDKKAVEETEGAVFGTTGESKRMESISIELGTKPEELGIEYRSHVQGIGWEKQSAKDGEVSGTTGESKRLEAVQMQLTGAKAKDYDVFYRVHSQSFGWLGWATNGEPAGTAGQAKRAEAVEVLVLPKGQTPKDYDATKAAYVGRATGVAHVQGTGTTKATNSIIGSTGKGKRLESLRITLPNQPFGGGIEYQSHVQGKGWETGWASNGGMSGTQGKSKRIEAVRIQLTGDLKDHFSVWYRVHSQTYGWGGWTKDGADAGTSGLSRRAEAIDVMILPKGAAAPGSTDNAMRTK
ncbi:MAG: hypothetical protein Q4A01_08875 [Coriobacteriales bacterium]|nr:hypothetical protein [Coriobacteriales bacterium]